MSESVENKITASTVNRKLWLTVDEITDSNKSFSNSNNLQLQRPFK